MIEKRDTSAWYVCENIVDHYGEIGLLRMDFPRVFVLVRHYGDAYFASFEDFKTKIAEVNFFTPSERKEADVDEILTEAWDFLAIHEAKEEELYNDKYEELDLP